MLEFQQSNPKSISDKQMNAMNESINLTEVLDWVINKYKNN